MPITTEVKIISGPGRSDLLGAFTTRFPAESHFEGSRVPIQIKIDSDSLREIVEIRVYVIGLEWEDGSGNSWNFHGNLWHPRRGKGKIRGYYNSSKRAGAATVEYESSL